MSLGVNPLLTPPLIGLLVEDNLPVVRSACLYTAPCLHWSRLTQLLPDNKIKFFLDSLSFGNLNALLFEDLEDLAAGGAVVEVVTGLLSGLLSGFVSGLESGFVSVAVGVFCCCFNCSACCWFCKLSAVVVVSSFLAVAASIFVLNFLSFSGSFITSAKPFFNLSSFGLIGSLTGVSVTAWAVTGSLTGVVSGSIAGSFVGFFFNLNFSTSSSINGIFTGACFLVSVAGACFLVSVVGACFLVSVVDTLLSFAGVSLEVLALDIAGDTAITAAAAVLVTVLTLVLVLAFAWAFVFAIFSALAWACFWALALACFSALAFAALIFNFCFSCLR